MITEGTLDLRVLPEAVARGVRDRLPDTRFIDASDPPAADSSVCLLYCGPDGWYGGRPVIGPLRACVVLVEGVQAVSVLASPLWPVAWVRLPWPADAHALALAIDHARRLRDAFAPVPAWTARAPAEAADADLGHALGTIGIYAFEFDLATGRRRSSGRERDFIGRASPTFADVAAQVHPDDRPTVLAAFARSRITGSPYQVEFRFLGVQGQYRWIRAVGAVLGRSAESPGRLQGISFDIHDDLKARVEFRRARAQWQQLMAGVGMRSWVWSADSGRRMVTDAISESSELDLDLHPDDQAGDQDRLKQAVARGERYENEVRIADGAVGWRWMRLIGYPLRDGEGTTVGLTGLALDTSEWHRLDTEIGELREILQQSLAAGRIYATEWQLDTRTRRTFGPAEEILGASSDRIDDALTLIHADDIGRVRGVFEHTVRTGLPYQTEFRICRPDGKVRWLYSVGKAWRDHTGQVKRLTSIIMDMTERRATEERLAQLIRQHEIALAAAELNPWSVDLRTEQHRTGPRDIQLYGEWIDSLYRFRARVLSEDWPQVDRLRDPAFLRSEQPLAIDFRIRLDDDSTRWISCVGRGVCDANGEPVELVGISRDVTAARQAQQQLLDSLARLDRVQIATGVLLWEWSRHSGARVTVPGGRVLQGSALPEVHSRDRMTVARRILACLGTDAELEMELRIRIGTAPWRWMSLHGRRVSAEGDEQEAYAGVLTDIGRSKRAELELAASLEWQQTAVATARLNLWRIDLDTGVRHRGSLDGDWYAEPLMTAEQAIALVHPEDYDAVSAALAAARAKDGDYEVECRVPTVTGGVRWLRLRGRCLTDADGRREVIGASVDVTDQKHATAELERAVAMAREASAAKSAFLAAVSHEMRTPLNAVIGYAGLLSGDALDPRDQQYLRALQAGASQLLAVINDVLDFSRIEAGSLVLEHAPLDPLACFENTVALVAAAAEDKGLHLTLECSFCQWSSLLGDATRLAQVGLNVLSNAIKFTPAGSVAMRLDREQEGDEAVLVVEVSDTGIGMSEGTIARLFTPFRQGEESTSRRFGGSGLGLSICRSLVERMGGTISVRSKPGEGSTFAIRLPWRSLPGDQGWALASLAGRRIGVCARSQELLGALTRQLNVLGAEIVTLPPEMDLAGQRLHERIDVMIAGKRALTHFLAQPAWAEASADLALIELVGFADAPGPATDPRAVAMPRVIRPRYLQVAIEQALKPPSTRAHQPAQAYRAGDPDIRGCAQVLIVEDNEINQLLLQAQLESLGFAADLAGSGEAALALLAQVHYPLILMDIEMPGMDGLETVHAVRTAPALADRQPWIIAVTAHVFMEMRARIRRAGFDDFIAKPVLIDQLSAALSKVRERRPD